MGGIWILNIKNSEKKERTLPYKEREIDHRSWFNLLILQLLF